MNDAILSALSDSPVCHQIVTFLMENESAMDTVKGVATWWIQCDYVATQSALDRLIACGVITVRTLSSGAIYGLTTDPEVRSLLRGSMTEQPAELRAKA